MNFFSNINKELESVKRQDVADHSDIAYILSLLLNRIEIEDVDFDRINLFSLCNLKEDVFGLLIEDEDEDGMGYENLILNPDHDFSKLNNIGCTFTEFVNSEKVRVPSNFRFL